MPAPPIFLHIAIPCPLYQYFDYLPPKDFDSSRVLVPGIRVRVPFGRSQTIGFLVGTDTRTTIASEKLKRVTELLDREPILSDEIFTLVKWAADYYHYPIGDAIACAVPTLIRKGRPLHSETVWKLSPRGAEVNPRELTRAPRQSQLLSLFQGSPQGLSAEQIRSNLKTWRPVLDRLLEKGWLIAQQQAVSLVFNHTQTPHSPQRGPLLNPSQQHAVDQVIQSLGQFRTHLLFGVTGSGKTEVYLQILTHVLSQGKQALVLVPEIGLTPQLVRRFASRLKGNIGVLHSGLSDRERFLTWCEASRGDMDLIIGTRSAIFTPLARLGVIILDEEHDASFKQQEGFRYSARALALVRAQHAKAAVILGSATPALESFHNAQTGKFELLRLPERAGCAKPPSIELLDIRSKPLQDGLSLALLQHMKRHLDQDGQVLLFLNRRGYAPVLMCHDCGWMAECDRCDAYMTLHRNKHLLRCHHCGCQRPELNKCPQCSGPVFSVGQGTERMEQALAREFPKIGIERIDRDTTRRKGAMEDKLDRVRQGHSRILIGTQMLAKGHHLPEVTLVTIIDIDQGLYSSDFRGTEKMAQLVLQVAGRAGRADRPGQVLIQTHHPDHPQLQLLVQQDYEQFAKAALKEREEAQLPPFAHMALLRASATNAQDPQMFLQQAMRVSQRMGIAEVQMFGPVPAPMERRHGRYRSHLLVQSHQRKYLHTLLGQWVSQLDKLKESKRVRWSLDVDPIDMM